MKMKKLFTLLAILGMAVGTYAQVTFTLDGGSNDPGWTPSSYVKLNDEGGIWETNTGESSYIIFKATEATYIQGYTIKLPQLSLDGSGNYTDSGLPYSWTLYGSNDKDNNTWVRIHGQTQANRVKEDYDNGFFKSAGKSYTYYCNKNEQFMYYKLNVTGKYGGTWGSFKLAGFDLIPSDVGFSASGNGMDGNTGTKLEGGLPQTLTITGTGSARITGFQFTTGNDNASWTGRNPRTIKVQGSNDEGDNKTWTTLEKKTGYTELKDKNYYPYVFQCYGTQNYKYYRFTFDDVTGRDRGNGTTEYYFQMSELAIITESACTHSSYSSDGFCEKCLSPEAPETDGSGVYQITNAGKFVRFAEIVNNGTGAAKGKLTTDIDLTDVSWTPIGNSTNKYTGTFDGQLKNVTLNMTNNEGDYQGLFGVLGGNANISKVIVKGTVKGNNYVGGIAGGSIGAGTVHLAKCGNEANVTASGANGAGVFGCNFNSGARIELDCCYNVGTIASNTDGGALSAWLGGNNGMWGCFNIGEATNTGDGTSADFVRKSGGSVYSYCADFRSNQADVANGKLCYDLNVGKGSTVYYQTIGADNYPKLTNTSKQVILNGSYENVTSPLNLSENNTFNTTSDFSVTSINVTRTLKGEMWNTFCVPFDMSSTEIADQFGEGTEVKELTNVSLNDDNYTMTFTSVNEITAGKPYMVKVSSEVSSFSLSDKTIKSAKTDVSNNGLTFTGTYTNSTAPESSFIISNNVFYKVNSEVTLKAFRGYITISGAAVRALIYDFENEATSINEDVRVKNDVFNEGATIFNLAGQRINKAQKGLFIVNGKKIAVM